MRHGIQRPGRSKALPDPNPNGYAGDCKDWGTGFGGDPAVREVAEAEGSGMLTTSHIVKRSLNPGLASGFCWNRRTMHRARM